MINTIPFGQIVQTDIIHYEENTMDLKQIFGEVLQGEYSSPQAKADRAKRKAVFDALGWDGKLHDKV